MGGFGGICHLGRRVPAAARVGVTEVGVERVGATPPILPFPDGEAGWSLANRGGAISAVISHL